MIAETSISGPGIVLSQMSASPRLCTKSLVTPNSGGMDSCGLGIVARLQQFNKQQKEGVELAKMFAEVQAQQTAMNMSEVEWLGGVVVSDGSQRHCPMRGERSHVMTRCLCTKFQNQTPNPPPPTKEGFSPRKLMPAAKYWKVQLPSYQATWVLSFTLFQSLNTGDLAEGAGEIPISSTLWVLVRQSLKKSHRWRAGRVPRWGETHGREGLLCYYFPCCNWDERGSSNLVVSTWHLNRLRWLLCSHNDTMTYTTCTGPLKPQIVFIENITKYQIVPVVSMAVRVTFKGCTILLMVQKSGEHHLLDVKPL